MWSARLAFGAVTYFLVWLKKLEAQEAAEWTMFHPVQ